MHEWIKTSQVERRTEKALINFTPSEMKALKAHAKKAKLPVTKLVRLALESRDLFTDPKKIAAREKAEKEISVVSGPPPKQEVADPLEFDQVLEALSVG